MSDRSHGSGPWIVAALALIYAWWPGGLERYSIAIAYDDLRYGVREAAYMAEQVSRGVADPEEAAFLRGRIDLFIRDTYVRDYPFGTFRRADRLHARQWQEWGSVYGTVWTALRKQVNTDSGPIPAPMAEQAQLYREMARELRRLAEDLQQPWEPVSGPALYERGPGSYLNGRLRARIRPHFDALSQQAFVLVNGHHDPSPTEGEGGRRP